MKLIFERLDVIRQRLDHVRESRPFARNTPWDDIEWLLVQLKNAQTKIASHFSEIKKLRNEVYLLNKKLLKAVDQRDQEVREYAESYNGWDGDFDSDEHIDFLNKEIEKINE